MALCESPVYAAVLLITILACVLCNIGLVIDNAALSLSSLATASTLVLIDIFSKGLLTSSHCFRCWRLALDAAFWACTILLVATALQRDANGILVFVTGVYAVRSVIRTCQFSEDLINESHPNRTIQEISIVLPQIELRASEDSQAKEGALTWRNSTADEVLA